MHTHSWKAQAGSLVRGIWGRLLAATLVLASAAALAPGAAQAAGEDPGAVYVMSNAPAGNAVLVFNRGADGALTTAGSYATGGTGTGAGLGSQGALVVSDDGRWLLAVNAGSNSVAVFEVRPDGLQLDSTTPSGGVDPISLSIHDRQVYVLNAGAPGSINGFVLDAQGQLLPVPGSQRWLSNGGVGAAPGPAEVAFSPNGRALVVTEKATNLIDTFSFGDDQQLSNAVVHASAGLTPFGFGFDKHDTLIVSEAFGGAPNGSAVSSYHLNGDSLQAVSASAATHQTSACWIVVTGNNQYTYTTDAASGAVSGYRVANDGSLTLLNADGQSALIGAGSGVADMALSQGSRYLYVFAGGFHQIVGYQVQADGSLAPIGATAIPAGAAGIAAR